MQARRLAVLAALLALPVAVPFLLVAVVGGFAATEPALAQQACAPPLAGLGAETVGGTTLDAEQMGVATQIVAAVRGFPATSNIPHAAVVALATARQESGLRNLDYGDRDSLGAFQQRPSQGWGTPEQVRNVTHATTSFLQRLVRQPEWQTRPVTEVAADVQRPAEAYRGLYAQWVPLATALTERLWPTGLGTSSLTLTPITTSHSRNGWVLPMQPGTYTLTAGWHQPGELWSSGFHTGQDFAAPSGTPVYAAAAGRIELRPEEASWAGRHLVTIDHGTIGGRQIVSWYAHLSRAEVSDGQQVVGGQRIGLVGAEGNVTGPHLHFEVRLDEADVDPMTWLDGAAAPSLGPIGCRAPGLNGVPGVAGPSWPRPGTPVVASFNVLGHSHTKPGGNRCCRWADSATRIRWATTLLNRSGVTVAGLQEFQAAQAREFHKLTSSTWAMYPGVTSGRWNVNAIIWRTEVWQLVAGRSYETPYFFGHMRRMPVVLLRHRASGQQVWFTNHHNPADAHGDASRWRRRATAIEIAHTRDLVTTGPVVVTGDMNEREMFFCRFTARTPMHAANGGTNTAGSCRPPRPSGVDWIFGSPEVRFSGYQSVRTGLVRRTSDHPLVVATMDIAP